MLCTRTCQGYATFCSDSKLSHPAKLEQRDVINALAAVEGNHRLRIEGKPVRGKGFMKVNKMTVF